MDLKLRHGILLLAVVLILAFVGSTNGVFVSIAGDNSERRFNIQEKISDGEVDTVPIDEAEGDLVAVSTQGFPTQIENGDLVVFSDQTGEIVYYESNYGMYFDINEYPLDDSNKIRYTASERLNGEDCSQVKTNDCTRIVYREVNISTGESRTIYSKVTPYVSFTRPHDIDQINETHIVVASIYNDGVYSVNTETGEEEWLWRASEEFNRPDGKELDWTHLNDVDVLQDGTLMLNLRNQDQVVFIEQRNGEYVMNDSMTLGSENDYDIVYEQHNPDYIPASRGGPAVIIGDSENNRVVEYQRVNGEWKRTFEWVDTRMQWTRDADRLENGTTLVTDSNGERVMQLGQDGNIMWRAFIDLPYESETIDGGKESVGNSYQNVTNGDTLIPNPSSENPLVGLKYYLPRSIVNGLLFALPPWIHYFDLLLLVSSIGLFGLWITIESASRYREKYRN